MRDSIDDIVRRAVSPATLRVVGTLTNPRSYGVYRLPADCGATRRYRFGNHPVRMRELENQFESCTIEYLFLSRADAMAIAVALNVRR